MNISKTNNLACPIDGLPLETREKNLTCVNGHVYDIAKQGYINLLPVQHKRSKHPGDSKAMVTARSEFLNSDIYQPVAQQLAEITSTLIEGNEDTCLLDAGCGEGYYLDAVYNNLKNKKGTGSLSLIGMDISKPAITMAAKRNKMINWIVGTNRQPPVNYSSIDIVLCVFGFHNFEGFTKILKPGAMVVLVEPGPHHLKELKELIYSEVKKHDPQKFSSSVKPGYSIKDENQLQFNTLVSGSHQINNLLTMTPHLYRANKSGLESARMLDSLSITVDVIFRLFEKQ